MRCFRSRQPAALETVRVIGCTWNNPGAIGSVAAMLHRGVQSAMAEAAKEVVLRRSFWVMLAVVCAMSLALFAVPRIEADTVYEFGEVLVGDVVTHAFVLTNVGDEPLVISRVTATCGCTTVNNITGSQLAPGESIELIAKFTTYGSGTFAKNVNVYSNDPSLTNGMLTLRLIGTVRSPGEYGLPANDLLYQYYYLLIDLRDPAVYDQAHLNGAISVAPERLLETLDSLRAGVPVFVYDDDGTGALAAAETLAEAGFTQVYALRGGLDGWRRAYGDDMLTGEATDSPGEAPEESEVHSRYLDPLYLASNYVLIVDVRSAEAFEENHLVGAVHVEEEAVAVRIESIPEDVVIVFYDETGDRAGLLAESLLLAGRTGVYSLVGGFDTWIIQWDVYMTTASLSDGGDETSAAP